MTRPIARCVAAGLTALVLACATGGVAQAADTSSIWVVPGAVAGPLLDPVVQAPSQALAPVFGLLGAVGG